MATSLDTRAMPAILRLRLSKGDGRKYFSVSVFDRTLIFLDIALIRRSAVLVKRHSAANLRPFGQSYESVCSPSSCLRINAVATVPTIRPKNGLGANANDCGLVASG